ncbi:hypothetical protein XELAEV_18035862mg [Xenopus laevis]|uniref:GIY-YIG domain-containing protein n=1 Tax=Xenopus laevis TaxID=8355 RepID=A0A974CIN7_XENLA|nr:hypothetical protein XELAEV_18035862mg [Xenopus laevis]
MAHLFACKKDNVVYLIMCLKCPTTGLYVGETGQTLRQQMNSHRFNIKHSNTDAPVAAHFCSNTHSIKDLRVTVLKGNFKTQQKQKEVGIQTHAKV